jgi:hypothetical protein
MPVICKSTRSAAGCGHPVGDHDGNQERSCCCCNRQHNYPEHVSACLECNIRRIKHQLGTETITAEELAEHLPQHLRRPFWRAAVHRYIREELGGLP